jgi:hypothetical protein
MAMTPPKVAVVIASNRAACLQEFLAAWTPAPWDETIVVEDGPERSFQLADPASVHHVSWQEIAADPSVADPLLFSRRDSAIKVYGIWTALRLNVDVVVLLDDDCFPVSSPAIFVAAHLAALSPRQRWMPIDDFPSRGLPYFDLGMMDGAVANMGLWQGVADHDAPQSLALQRAGGLHELHSPGTGNRLIHPQHYWPFCGMNVAFRREIAPLMYMPKMGEGSPFRRFDDIWCGVILQRCCRHLGLQLAAGEPHIRHVRRSDPLVNLVKEAPGIHANEHFWKVIEATPLDATAQTPLECTEAVGRHLADPSRNQDAVARDPTLASYLVDEGNRILAWCAMFRAEGWT